MKDQDLYVIVDADDPDEPLGRFDDDARLEGWLRFRTLEDQLDGEPEPKGFLTRRRAQRASRLRDREVRNRED